jgi:hypothetical protein
MNKHPQKVLYAVTLAYATALSINDPVWRAENQYVLATLRDLIADMTGRDSEEIQNIAEATQ